MTELNIFLQSVNEERQEKSAEISKSVLPEKTTTM